MKILEKFIQKQDSYAQTRQPVIAFLGDSVTHGCFDIFISDEELKTKVKTELAYHEKVRKIFSLLYPEVPLCIINAGVSGDTAKGGLERLERDVLSYKPDIVVVCYGLNDAMERENGLNDYVNSLKTIFCKIEESGAQAIFMTPNMRTNHISEPFGDKRLSDAVNSVMQNENEGWLDKYLDEIRASCKELGIKVCDCHYIWKQLISNGVKVNHLLSNRVNHPIEELHWLFAYELVKVIFEI